MEPEVFERSIRDALDELPAWTDEYLENVAVLAEEEDPDDPDLLGIYLGVPETERGHEEPVEPPRILIFRRPIVAMCDSEDEVREEIRITVIHEIGHHFGLSEQRLDELGWG